MAELIMLDGQILNGSDRLGDWKTNSLEGWWASPDPRGEDAERANADGDYDLEVFYKARYITVSGRIYSPSHDQLHQAMNRFSALVQKSGRLQVSGHGQPQWADVKRASGFSMAPVTDTLAQWQARLKAPDPRKFGNMNTFSAAVGVNASVLHWGNYSAKPRFVVTGTMAGGYVLTVGGQQFIVTQPLWFASPHTIDYNDGRLRIGGAVVHGGLGTTATPGIKPGTVATVSIAPLTTGTATAAISLLDTYI